MEYEKKELFVYHAGNTVTDQFTLDDDFNIPDAKQDVSRVVLAEGSLQIEDIKQVENYVRVSGKLYFKVLYVTEEGEKRLAFLDGRIPFEEMVYVQEETDGKFFMKSDIFLWLIKQ